MKTLLIKAGKAFTTLKKEGPIRGGKRVASAFFAMFRKVGSGDILYITGGVGDSAKYRCWRQAEELSLHGFRCAVTVQDNPLLPRYADKFKIFIFHRVLHTPSVKKIIERIKAQKKEIIFETDDLVHDPKYLRHMDYFKKMNKFEKMLYENGVGGEILKDDYVKTCVTTTAYLADILRDYGKRVFVSKNKLSNYDVEVMNDVHEKRKKASNGEKIKIGYFSGTASHDKDFETVKDAMIRILEKYPQVEMHLFGPLEIDRVYAGFGERVKKHPFAPWEKHLGNIGEIDINIAPLEIGSPYCESKSELKFIEAGMMGAPTVAAATRTFKEIIEDGADGFTASGTEEWIEKLGKLILNPDLRKSMGEKAREKVLQEYTNKNSRNEEYYKYLRSKL